MAAYEIHHMECRLSKRTHSRTHVCDIRAHFGVVNGINYKYCGRRLLSDTATSCMRRERAI